MKLSRTKLLKTRNIKNLLEFLNKGTKIVVNVVLQYIFSGDGTLKWSRFSMDLNKNVIENKELYEQAVRDRFRLESHGDDHGYSNIEKIEPPKYPRVSGSVISDLPMRFTNEGNDCVFKELFIGIKNINGYHYYSIKKIKDEFISLGIDVSDGVSINKIKEWIVKNSHNINIYFFSPELKLIDYVKGNKLSHKKTPQLIFVYNNGHCYQIYEEEIKRSIIHGGTIDLNKFNPTTKFEFNSFKDYQVITFNQLKDDIEDLNKYDEVILVETTDSFVKMVQFLTTIDNTQINFIDANRECILFKDHLIFRVKDYNLRKMVCESINRDYELLI